MPNLCSDCGNCDHQFLTASPSRLIGLQASTVSGTATRVWTRSEVRCQQGDQGRRSATIRFGSKDPSIPRTATLRLEMIYFHVGVDLEDRGKVIPKEELQFEALDINNLVQEEDLESVRTSRLQERDI